MAAVILQRAGLVVVIMTGDGQDGDIYALILLGGQRHTVPISVRMGMLHPGLEKCGAVADDAVQLFEWQMVLVHLLEFSDPETGIIHKCFIAGGTTGVGEPLDLKRAEDIGAKWEIHRGVGRGRRDDGFEVRGCFPKRQPLVITCVRASPHCHLPIAPGLLRQPFHHVMTIPGFMGERLKNTLGIAPPA